MGQLPSFQLDRPVLVKNSVSARHDTSFCLIVVTYSLADANGKIVNAGSTARIFLMVYPSWQRALHSDCQKSKLRNSAEALSESG